MLSATVGSDSIFKVHGTHLAFDQLERQATAVGIKAESGVPAMPVGREQIILGATNRADAARALDRKSYAIGIENGIMRLRDVHVDVAYVVIYAPSGRKYVLRSAAIEVPPEIVAAVLACGQTKTSGQFEAERSGCDHRDPHVVWSHGRTDREQLLTAVLYAALYTAITNEEGELK